ncbi:VOC family protein [Alkalicoccus chagannorensis]|uniref:VOC family protein n=1 Tax=Alkalicoccus chagannorensis TaxID=427072 RepID=UPI0003F923C2|nr:VOC family protein [Alkalicoccus chagannorensis]
MSIIGTAHTAFTSGDMAASIQFYTEVLQLDHAFSVPAEDGSPWIEYIRTGPQQYIELFHGGSVRHRRREGEIGPHHLCLLAEDIESIKQQLDASGWPIKAGPKRGIGKNWQLWLEDPDGNLIECIQPDADSPHLR